MELSPGSSIRFRLSMISLSGQDYNSISHGLDRQTGVFLLYPGYPGYPHHPRWTVSPMLLLNQ